MAAEKKHPELTRVESQRLGLLGDRQTAEAQLLRAKRRAQQAFLALQEAEAQAASVHLGPDIDKRGAVYRREQASRDNQLIGRYSSATRITDPDLAQRIQEAKERLRRAGEVRAAPAIVEKAQQAYDAAIDSIARNEANVAREQHDRAITEKQAELDAAIERARRTPSASADVTRIAAELEKLTSQS
jgi:hypothetical protein